MEKINYQRKLDELLKTINGTPRLLLHSCCAPCSSYCLEYLSRYFAITVLYYNPNIYPEEEFVKRAEEQRRLISELKTDNPVELVVAEYDPEEFFSAVEGLEQCAEGGERCFVCYRLRLQRAAEYAAENGFDYFCSTLSISPLKNAQKLNEIGSELSEIYKVPNLPNDFKKKGGYLRSIELSREHGLYRQNYCGCVFSKQGKIGNV
ncbi:MAG: epoxyqueuosine reductase QueH [Oscillospiraceae bacterium]|nr:epoxyqueuosine reductase QueH [Oscillospiraceae bacterium]